MREKFKAFLKKHKVYKEFENNTIKHGGFYDVKCIDDYINIDMKPTICGGFKFSKTDEGENYWADIHDLWEAELNN